MNFGQVRRIIMAQRPVFVINEKAPFFCEEMVEFEFNTGFAFSQKQKTIENMHDAIRKGCGERNILEVSRYSKEKIGRELSAFN